MKATVFQRLLPDASDPLALYATLSDSGQRPNTMLFERSEGPSFILDRAALRAECRGQEVILIALSNAGRRIIDSLASNPFATTRQDSELHLRFPRVEGSDAAARLLSANPFDLLRSLIAFDLPPGEEPFAVTLPGIVAFDHVDFLEEIAGHQDDPLDFPDYVFWLAESLVLFQPGARPRLICTAFGEDEKTRNDAAERLARLHERCAGAPALPETVNAPGEIAIDADLDDEAYCAVVTRLKAHIARGDVYQIVPSRTFRAPCPDPLAAYAALRRLDPSPYRFFVSAPGHILFGASPETSVRVGGGEDGPEVEVKPIAGTRPRGATPDEDDRLEAEMRLDQKELAEHMMLVDLARNDVARVSRSGTRRVAKLMTVERYARVMHLVSSVTGALRPDLDAFHALQACLNVGTLTGAPKIRATQLLRETERTKRGPYGGAIGWVNGAGHMDTGVVIRSAVVKDGTAFVRAGAGVVHDSDPAREADETRRKASAMLSVLAGAGGGR